ncbi:hypothetical protein SPHINGOR109_70021 [Sphingorhabdus sp. 109]|nr:hypothetical protein SPHINGOR109_70021 [Sphingorhabdus sp. 109]
MLPLSPNFKPPESERVIPSNERGGGLALLNPVLAMVAENRWFVSSGVIKCSNLFHSTSSLNPRKMSASGLIPQPMHG